MKDERQRAGSERRGDRPPAVDPGWAGVLEGILGSMVDGVFASDRELRYLYVSPSAAKLMGTAPENLIGRTWDEVHAAVPTLPWKDLARQVIETRRPLRHEAPFRGRDGERFYETIMSPVLDDRGEVSVIVSIARDVTERKHAEFALALANATEQRARARATKLHDIAAALSRAGTLEDVGAVIVHQALEALGAESAVAYFMRPDGQLSMGALRGFPEELVAHLKVLPPDAPLPLPDAVRRGQPVWIESIEALLARYPDVTTAKVQPGKVQAVAAIPLRTDDRTLGGVGFSFGTPRTFDDDERRFLLTLANHAALAAERCRLRQEERAARSRLTILAEATRRFSEAKLELRDTLDTIAREVASRLLDSCAINLLTPDERVLEPVAIANVDPEAEEATRKTMAAAPVRMDETSSLARVARSGEPMLVPVIPLEAWLAASARPEYREHHRRFPISSLLIVPLRARDRIIGTITVSRGARGPPYTPEDQALLQDLADRAGLALANARQHEELGRERRRLDVLARASEVLATSLDYETTLRNVIELALPTLGDFGFFDVVESSGDVRRLARAHQDPERQAILDQTSWVRSDRKDKILCALSSGTSGFHPDIDDAWLRDVAVSPGHLALMQKLAFCSMITVPLSGRGAILGSLTLFFADSRRHHSEVDLRLAEELARRAAAAVENARLFRESREAVAVRDDFLSIAGHELNTPLAALQLQIQSLKRQAEKDGANGRLLERLSKTEGHVTRLAKLINELLDVSRIAGGRLKLEQESMDLAGAVKDVLERLSAHAAAAGCKLVYQGADRIPGEWDRLRIEQVVTNLIGNSVKYAAGKPIEAGASVAGGVARIVVRDYGIGISPADEERIFGRFERAVSHRHYGGFGLGLWISRQIVEAHGGNIRFERPEDVGTRFVIELPLNGR